MLNTLEIIKSVVGIVLTDAGIVTATGVAFGAGPGSTRGRLDGSFSVDRA